MRLGISEYYEIDKTRRLILVRRDNVEHLVLIGGGQDVVIEPGISGRGSEPGMQALPGLRAAARVRAGVAARIFYRRGRADGAAQRRSAAPGSDRARHPDRRYS